MSRVAVSVPVAGTSVAGGGSTGNARFPPAVYVQFTVSVGAVPCDALGEPTGEAETEPLATEDGLVATPVPLAHPANAMIALAVMSPIVVRLLTVICSSPRPGKLQ